MVIFRRKERRGRIVRLDHQIVDVPGLFGYDFQRLSKRGVFLPERNNFRFQHGRAVGLGMYAVHVFYLSSPEHSC